MQTTTPVETAEIALPFVGRETELARLKRFHAQRRHVLLLGPAGAGQSALLQQLAQHLPLLICPESARLTEMFSALEQPLGLEAAGLPLVRRKNRLLAALARAGQTVVFDGVGWTTPRMSSFLESVMERVPIWICTRSAHPWDLGHLWPLLVRLERIELPPFRPAETRALIAAAVNSGIIPRAALNLADRMHRRSGGCPRLLHAWLERLARGAYDLSDPQVLRRLDLDRRMDELCLCKSAES